MMKKVFTRSNLIRRSWILFLFAAMHFAAAGQTSHAVSVTSNVFTPDEITINVGDTVVWTNSQGSHNVNGTQANFPANPEYFGTTVGMGWVFSHVFTIAGNYDYRCDPHFSFGMTGKVKVEDLASNTVTVNLSGMTPHLGQEIYFALIDVETGEVIDRKSEIVLESFSVILSEIQTGKAYYVDFFSDHNNNGQYDAPPVDHAWRLEIASASGNEVFDFIHNTNFTDIMWKHRLRVRFSGMTPHLGQMLTLYVRELPSGNYLDTVVVAQVEDADFDVKSYVLEPGNSYLVDFYADHNGNDKYDAPPTDHAWRIETGVTAGDVDIDFMHNTNFTDIQPSASANVLLAMDTELGKILTDSAGYTLYYFTKDALPDTSLCTGGCVTNWPLFYAENLVLGDGLESSDFSSIEHPEGGMQTTYKGWPLYYFKNDLNPGETFGEAVGNVWFVAKPDYSIMLIDNLLVGKDGVTYNSNYEPGEEVVQYFVDEYGMTLYIFINDRYNQNNFTNPDFSNDADWPIYEEELQAVASTVDTSLFDIIDVFGRQQLTYNGWPLYYFGGDSLRGNATGVSVPKPGIWPVAVKDLEAPAVTSVDDFNINSGLQLYPNPVINELNIISDEIIESVSIISMTGARILTIKDVQATDYVISLDGVSAGIYFVEVRSTDHTIQVERMVKR
ncbi:MAG: plastocyanin/azurin family copper-binding protein [Bacteroidales bacterium]